MKHTTQLAAATAVCTVAVMLSACGGGGGGSAMTPPPSSPEPPPPPAATNFTTFMHGQTTATSPETAEPVELETMQWAFTDDDNETAYDDVLATSM